MCVSSGGNKSVSVYGMRTTLDLDLVGNADQRRLGKCGNMH